MRRSLTRWVLTVYLVLVLAALVAAVVRLSESAEMPGLSAIELVLLALPWSLALQFGPGSRFGLVGMATIVLGGVALNALILRWLAARMSFVILRGVAYSAAFVWLWSWLAISVRELDPGLPFSLPLWLRPIGFALAFAGALLTVACITTFLTKGRGTPAPFDPPREFVASGPYRYVRNPMYVGAAAVILGAGLVVSSPSIVLLTLLFLLTMHFFVVVHEEPTLAAKFGASYQQYKATVHRWLIRKPKRDATRG